jgi:hypothetical protein
MPFKLADLSRISLRSIRATKCIRLNPTPRSALAAFGLGPGQTANECCFVDQVRKPQACGFAAAVRNRSISSSTSRRLSAAAP